MNRLLISSFLILLTLASLPSVFAKDSDWPRTVPLGQGMVTIYSPQIDEMSENTIQFRAALAYRATAGSEPVFGAGWFESPVTVDSSNRIVQPAGLNLTDTRFPEGTDDIQSELASVLAQQSRGWNLDFSLDELENSLKTAELETEAVNTSPPRIIYRDNPALLISIDGEPVLQEIENSSFKAVINTPYPLITDGKYFYLNAAKDVWYRARKATGPYQFEAIPPAAIAAMVNPDDEVTSEDQVTEAITAANAPEIVVSTEPAELIVTEGPAAFVPLVEDLLVLQNSDDDVFMHVSSQKFYIVLAGRWYQANSLTGPWAYQAADDLPGAFANIPRDSEQADSRVYVAGTEEAKDAILDAQVPQTAAVQRGEVDIEVKYDGEPVYQEVDGTDLVYIRNTGSTVLMSGGLYYLVEEGVWYVSSSPNGPWQVSDHRPEQVDTILPTSPVYNTKYVHVYDSTPSVVYVGYTPGYTGSYVYRNTIFYGTGWYYRPWVSPYYYYPRVSTWGFNVNYNSWSGWNFGLSWGWGPFNVSYYSGGYWHHRQNWYHRNHGRWGPGRYRHRAGHNRRGHDRYAHNGSRRGGRDYQNRRYDGRDDDRRYDNGRDRGGNSRPRDDRQNDNLYRDTSQRASVANTRDNPRRSNRYAADNRQVVSTNINGKRVNRYAGKDKAERNRTGPVRPSELRTKARVRDVNQQAKRSALLTDNNGRIYSKADRKQDRSSRLGGVGKKERPVSLASAQPSRTWNSARRGKGKSSATGDTSSRRSQQKTADSRQTTPATARKPYRQSQPRTIGNDARQRNASTSKAPARQSQSNRSGNNTGQVSRSAARTPAPQMRESTRQATAKRNASKAPTRQSQSNRSGNNTGQVSRQAARTPAPQMRQSTRQTTGKRKAVKQPARNVPTQARRQNNPTSVSGPKASRSTTSRQPAPAAKATHNSARKTSHQRSSGKSGKSGSKRESRGRGSNR